MARQHREQEPPAAAHTGGRGETISLHVVVFVCGAVLMAFEMVGSRILAPTFGNTIFVWGSLIGVFLAALSLGYLVGGRLADRVPKFWVLGAVIAVAGLLILVVPLVAPHCCRWIDRQSSGQRLNPLVASTLLFFIPSMLLGMVSPFSVRLQARSVATVGNVAGRLYSLSTLGSIAGTIVATFWFIPAYGTSNIVKALGVCLVAVSLLATVPSLLDRIGAPRGWLKLAGRAAALIAALGLAVATPWLLPVVVSSAAGAAVALGLCAALLAVSALGLCRGWNLYGRGAWVCGIIVAVSYAALPLALLVFGMASFRGGELALSLDAPALIQDFSPIQTSLVAVAVLAFIVKLSLRWGWGLTGAVACAYAAGGLVAVPSPSYVHLEEGEKLVAEVDSPYQHIGVVLLSRGYSEESKQWSLRMMFDKYIESEIMVAGGDSEDIRIREPYESGAKYTDTLHIPWLFNKDAKSVLIVGGGGGVVPTIFRRDYPQLETIDVVEIDPTVVEVARKYFGFRPGENGVSTTIMDGRVYMRDCTRQYDIIILDAFTGGRPPFHLLTREFLELVKARLSPKGVVHLNIISALEGERSPLFWAMLKTFQAVFGPRHLYVFPKLYDQRWVQTRPRTDGMNVELVALNFDDFENPLSKDAIVARARERVGPLIKLHSVLRHAENHQTMDDLLCTRDSDPNRANARQREWNHAPILTDDYAPVDNWVTD